MTGVASFVIEYPNDDPGNAQIQSIAFGSNQLVGKTQKTLSFRLSVHVRTPDGGKPQAYVLNTDPPVPKTSGEATLVRKGNQLTLEVRGENDMKEKIDLTVVCE